MLYATLFLDQNHRFALELPEESILAATGVATAFAAGVAAIDPDKRLLLMNVGGAKPRATPCFKLRDYAKIGELLARIAQLFGRSDLPRARSTLMTILYKLTDQDNFTRRGETNECLWGPDITHRAHTPERGVKRQLCCGDVIHVYEHPLIALIMNPQHAAIAEPKLLAGRGRDCCPRREVEGWCCLAYDTQRAASSKTHDRISSDCCNSLRTRSL